VSGGVSRFRGHGGFGFTRAVRVWRVQATSVWDRDCGLARMAGRGGKGNLPSRVACPCFPSNFHLGEAEEPDEREEGDESWSPSVSDARESAAGRVAAS
jgi:hypothetical protein